MCVFDIFYTDTDKLELVNDLDENELLTGSLQKEWILMRGDFNMTDSFEFSYYEWREF